MAMENWIVCASVTPTAREVIESNGGKIEVLREERPRLVLVTVAEALYHGFHEEDGYFSYELSRRDGGRGGTGQGICWWNDDPIALQIYRWDGSRPGDPKLDIQEQWAAPYNQHLMQKAAFAPALGPGQRRSARLSVALADPSARH